MLLKLMLIIWMRLLLTLIDRWLLRRQRLSVLRSRLLINKRLAFYDRLVNYHVRRLGIDLFGCFLLLPSDLGRSNVKALLVIITVIASTTTCFIIFFIFVVFIISTAAPAIALVLSCLLIMLVCLWLFYFIF
jgi:hypothetical protein